MKTKMKKQITNLLIKLGVTLGIVTAVFLLWGLANKVEAAGSEFRINSDTANDQKNVVIAVDSNNRFYIVWEDNREQIGRFDIFGRIFDSNGNSVTTDQTALENSDKSCYSPSLVVNNEGNVLVAWKDERYSAWGRIDIFARLYKCLSGSTENLGTPQDGPGGNNLNFRINDDLGTYTCNTPSVTTDGINFVTSYFNQITGAISEGNDGTTIKLAFNNSAAYPLDKKTAISGDLQTYDTAETAVCENPSDSGGWKRAVAWISKDTSKVYIQRYNNYGVKVGDVKVFNPYGTSSKLSIASNSSGDLGIVWLDKQDSLDRILCSVYKDGQYTPAATLMSLTHHSGYSLDNPEIFAKGDKFGVAYLHQKNVGAIVARPLGYNANNQPILEGSETLTFSSNYSDDFTILPLTTSRRGLSFIITLSTGINNKYINAVKGSLIYENGSWIKKGASEKNLISETSGVDYTQPKIAQIAPGQYAFAFAQTGNKIQVNSFEDKIFLSTQSISSPLSNETKIVFTGSNPQIATDNNGALAVTYQNESKIYVRRYDPNLKALSGAMRVDETSSQAKNPSITALADGNFLVSFAGVENNKYQTQHTLVKPYSSSLTSSTFTPYETSRKEGFNPLISRAYAADAATETEEGVEWGKITWEEKNGGDQSSVIVLVSTDKGSHWLAMSNGESITKKIKSSGIDMPSISQTIKYKIIVSSTNSNQSPSLNWIQIGYGPSEGQYDYFIKVSPATSNVVVKTTQELTIKVTRKEKQAEGIPLGLYLIPKAHAEAIGETEGEPLANQEVTAQITSGNFGKLSQKTPGTPSAPSGGETTPTSGETGQVEGDTDQAGQSDDILSKPLFGKTDSNGEFTFNYIAPETANLSDTITVATIPLGKSKISAEAQMTSVFPVNAVFAAKPMYVGNKKPVTFMAEITNHMQEPFKNITSDVVLNNNLQYIANSAKINDDPNQVRVVMENGKLSFEYIGTGEEALGEGSGTLKPGQKITLSFEATATITESKETLGQINLYQADLTLKYQNQKNQEYTNDPVTATGTVASIWLQTLYGDIYSQGGFAADVLPPSGNENATYLIQTDGTISHFTTKAGDKYQIQNYVQGILSPVNVKRLMRDQIDQILADRTKYHVRTLTPGLHSVSELDKGQKEVVYINGDLILTGPGQFKSPLTVIVKGNLTIKENISYDNSPVDNIKKLPSLGFIVLGNTEINPKVTRGVGALYTEGNLATGDSTAQLIWEGLWVAEYFNLQRTHFHTGTTLEAAEKVIYDGRVFANTPTGFSQLTDYPKWKEVSPK